MTTILAVSKFKSGGINHNNLPGNRHNEESSGRRIADNHLAPPQHSSAGQNDACAHYLTPPVQLKN